MQSYMPICNPNTALTVGSTLSANAVFTDVTQTHRFITNKCRCIPTTFWPNWLPSFIRIGYPATGFVTLLRLANKLTFWRRGQRRSVRQSYKCVSSTSPKIASEYRLPLRDGLPANASSRRRISNFLKQPEKVPKFDFPFWTGLSGAGSILRVYKSSLAIERMLA